MRAWAEEHVSPAREEGVDLTGEQGLLTSMVREVLQVRPYALGALMRSASMGSPDHDDSVRIIHKALDAGVNFIDTADAVVCV